MFDLDIVNAFSVSSVVILKNYCNAYVQKGRVRILPTTTSMSGMAVFVGITGDLSGRILFNMNKETALKVASILNDEDLLEVDDIFVATIKEFTNMVAGGAINDLSTKHIDLDLTPPSIMISSKMSLIDYGASQMLAVEYNTDLGPISLNILLDN